MAHQAREEALLLASLVPVILPHPAPGLRTTAMLAAPALLPHQLQAVRVSRLRVKKAPADLVDPPRQTKADQEARVDLVAAPRPTKAQAAVHLPLLREAALHLHQEPAAHLGPRPPLAHLEDQLEVVPHLLQEPEVHLGLPHLLALQQDLREVTPHLHQEPVVRLGPRRLPGLLEDRLEQTLHLLEAVVLLVRGEPPLRVGAMDLADHLQAVQREARVQPEAQWDLLPTLLHVHQMAQPPARRAKTLQALQLKGQVPMEPTATQGAVILKEPRSVPLPEAIFLLGLLPLELLF